MSKKHNCGKQNCNKKHKQKIIDRTFNDQMEDAWHLIQKRRKLKRKELFIKIEDTKEKNQ